MAASDPTSGGVEFIGTPVNTGSVQSEWRVVNSNGASASAAGVLYAPGSTNAASAVVPINIPKGATRMLIRQRLSSNATVGTTMSVVRPFSFDVNGVPTRLDSTAATATAAGLTLSFHTTGSLNISDGTYIYSPPASLEGLDAIGDKNARVLVDTASDHTAAVNQILVKFLN